MFIEHIEMAAVHFYFLGFEVYIILYVCVCVHFSLYESYFHHRPEYQVTEKTFVEWTVNPNRKVKKK